MLNNLFGIFKSIREIWTYAGEAAIRREEREKFVKKERELIDNLHALSHGFFLNPHEPSSNILDGNLHISHADRIKLGNANDHICMLNVKISRKYEKIWVTIRPYNPSYCLTRDLNEIIIENNTDEEFKQKLEIFSQKIAKTKYKVDQFRLEYQQEVKEFSKLT